mgnify:CR=1 FL=1
MGIEIQVKNRRTTKLLFVCSNLKKLLASSSVTSTGKFAANVAIIKIENIFIFCKKIHFLISFRFLDVDYKSIAIDHYWHILNK